MRHEEITPYIGGRGRKASGDPEDPVVLQSWVMGFNIRVHMEPNTGCWLWEGAVSPTGYAWVGRRGKQWTISRLVLRHKMGRRIKKGRFACHKCDTPACINPDHLYEGTPKQNTSDAVRRGRVRRKITEAQARELRARHKKGEMQKDLAAEFGLNFSTVSKIIRGRLGRRHPKKAMNNGGKK